MKQRRMQRFNALCAAFVMLFSSIPISTVADEAGSTAPVCGYAEHLHTDDCRQNVLVCGREESPPKTVKTFVSNFQTHQHSDTCRDEAGNLVCGMIEGEYYHTHNEFCRDEEGRIVCGLEEKRPHA